MTDGNGTPHGKDTSAWCLTVLRRTRTIAVIPSSANSIPLTFSGVVPRLTQEGLTPWTLVFQVEVT